MAQIAYENLPYDVKRAYKTTNTVRKVTLFISLVVGVLFYIFVTPAIEEESGNTGLGWKIADFFSSIAIGGVIHGLVHGEYAYKACFRNLFIFGLIPWLILVEGFGFIGLVFVIIDLIRLIFRKPLVYSFELKDIYKSKGLYMPQSISVKKEKSADNALDSLRELKSMLDDGLISEKDYEKKKQKLLKKLK